MSAFPTAPPLPSTPGLSGPRAGFLRRLAALVVDGIILLVMTAVVESATGREGVLLSFAIAIIYFGYREGGASGQTIGKRALGIRVVDSATGAPIGFGRAVVRYFGRWISAIPFFLGFFWMLWDRERQTWHDKFAQDVVVPVSAYPVARRPN
jgi:uncharacterized RDD family membrane protein YckC